MFAVENMPWLPKCHMTSLKPNARIDHSLFTHKTHICSVGKLDGLNVPEKTGKCHGGAGNRECKRSILEAHGAAGATHRTTVPGSTAATSAIPIFCP
jgi:hypothetical protein